MAAYPSLCVDVGRDVTVSSCRCRNQGMDLLGMHMSVCKKVGNQGEVYRKLEKLSRERNLEKQLLWTLHLLQRQVWDQNQGPAPRALYSPKIRTAAKHLGMPQEHGAG